MSSLFPYVTEVDNEWLTMDASDEEIREIANQISPLKAPDWTVCMNSSTKNAGILMVRIFV